jgi:hypothetical protein
VLGLFEAVGDAGEQPQFGVGRLLEVPGVGAHAGAAGLVPGFPPDLVERVGHPFDDVERIQADRGVLTAQTDDVADPLLGIAENQPDPGRSLVAEQVKEPLERLLVVPLGRPDQPAGVVVHDHGQVAVAALVGDLIDTDPAEPVERIDRSSGLVDHASNDRSHGDPRDAQQLDDRCLEVCTASQATVSSKARV